MRTHQRLSTVGDERTQLNRWTYDNAEQMLDLVHHVNGKTRGQPECAHVYQFYHTNDSLTKFYQ
ncbi:hypothetical protein TcasGA2_TC008050 [Tribolium castaneum]|uniref:Uncharacterized protein n=1 Tax=Tribolium castaneum TaxID=7070 RepID=D1ZZI4_TRICA|nr:hypothetical protein TcasGA2_TC008050 [Tribolium castaneum]